MGSHLLLQGIFPTQGLSVGLHLRHQGILGRLANPKSAALVWLETQERQWCRHILSASAGGITLIQGSQSFVLVGPSTDWMRPTHMLKGNLLSQSSLIWMLISSNNKQTITHPNIADIKVKDKAIKMFKKCYVKRKQVEKLLYYLC